MARRILHVDVDAMFASVEQLDQPWLVGRPLIVGGLGPRSVVATASYEARPFGVRSGMPMSQARRQCPHATVVTGRFDRYRQVSTQLMGWVESLGGPVEQTSLDEAYVDITDVPGPSRALARRLRHFVFDDVGLTVSVGIAPTKVAAKLASEAAKPNGYRIVDDGQLVDFLHGHPLAAVPGIGPKTTARLSELGLHDVADLADMSPRTLVRHVGQRQAMWLQQLAAGIDSRPVVTERAAKSIGAEHTFDVDVHGHRDVIKQVRTIGREAGRRLQTAGTVGTTVTVKLRTAEFRTLTRSRTGPPVDGPDGVAAAAVRIAHTFTAEQTAAVRLLGVSISNFAAATQLPLF